MKIYLDDTRETPEGWVRTYTASQTIDLLKEHEGDVEELSLDHDLGDDLAAGTGYDVLLWMEAQVATSNYQIPRHITVHSQNPVGKKKMWAAVSNIQKLMRERDGKQD